LERESKTFLQMPGNIPLTEFPLKSHLPSFTRSSIVEFLLSPRFVFTFWVLAVACYVVPVLLKVWGKEKSGKMRRSFSSSRLLDKCVDIAARSAGGDEDVLVVSCHETCVTLTHAVRDVPAEEGAVLEWNRLRGVRDRAEQAPGQDGARRAGRSRLRDRSEERLRAAFDQCLNWLHNSMAAGNECPVVCVVSEGGEGGKKMLTWLRRAARENAELASTRVDVRAVILAE